MDKSRRPILITSETTPKLPILIIDKEGEIGNSLCEKLKNQFLIVFVTNSQKLTTKNIIQIPYHKKIPAIPDNTYSHMFVIYNDEKDMLDILPALSKKAKQTNAKILFISSFLSVSAPLFKDLSIRFPHLEILLFGEAFNNTLNDSSQLSIFLRQARQSGRILVPNAGLRKTYPILFEDIIAGIIAVGFSLERRKKISLLFSKHPYTEMSLARMLQKRDPLLKIDFKKEKDKDLEAYIPEDGEYVFNNYDIEDKIKKLDLSRNPTKEKELVSRKKVSIIKKKKQKHLQMWYIVIIILILLLPVIITLASAGLGAIFLANSVKTIQTGNIIKAQEYANLAKIAFTSAQATDNTLSLLDIFVKSPNETLREQISTGQEISQTETETFSAIKTLQDIFNAKSLNPKDDFLHSLATLKNTMITLQKLKAEKKLPSNILTKLTEMNDTISLFENTTDALPLLLGFDEPKQYLILFQNNMELRPGGGFIGSYGLAKISEGKVNDFKVYDVYDADGKLTDHIEPPFVLRRYLGVSHWFLRDSNYDVDFSKDAITAANFLNLELGEKIDGVIAIDTDFLKKMLEVFGSITVPDYNQTVTPDNFYLLTQDHAEKDFFPGSTQKKDFLKTLYNTMFAQLTTNKKIPYSKIISKIGESAKEKHLMFAFPQSNTQQFFTVNNLSASLWDDRKKPDNGILDYFGVVDANLGTNKVNYYVKRNIAQKATVDDQGNLQETAEITYENTSNKGSPYAGDYKNYVRFILPDGAKLTEVRINDNPTPITDAIIDPAQFSQKTFLPPTELEVEKSQESGKILYGFLITIPTGQTKKVAITYNLPNAINADRAIFNYDLKLFKQPGTENDSYTFSLSYPDSFKLLKATPDISDVGGKIIYSTNLSQDLNPQANFTKK